MERTAASRQLTGLLWHPSPPAGYNIIPSPTGSTQQFPQSQSLPVGPATVYSVVIVPWSPHQPVGSSPLPVPLRRRRLHRHGGAPATDTKTTNCAKWSPPSARRGRRPRTLCSHMPASLAELTVTDGRPMSSVVLFSPSSAPFPTSHRRLRCVSSPRFSLHSAYESSKAEFTPDVSP